MRKVSRGEVVANLDPHFIPPLPSNEFYQLVLLELEQAAERCEEIVESMPPRTRWVGIPVRAYARKRA